MKSTRELVLWGGTGQTKVLAELVHGSGLELVAVVDMIVRTPPLPGVILLTGEADLDAWLTSRDRRRLVGGVAVGGRKGSVRLMLQERLKVRGIEIGTFIHKTAFVAANSRIGAGSQVLAHANVCAQAELGLGVILNTAASVDHDCVVEDGVHLAPGARLAGEVHVGRCAFLGIGAVVLPRLTIGANAVVGAGAVVIRSVPDGRVVVGNPARDIGAVDA